MNFLQAAEQFLLKIVHPEAKAALAGIAAQLAADKPALVAEFSTSGATAATFIEGKVTALVAKEPAVAEFLPFLTPLLTNFLTTEVGYGTTDIGEFIDKAVAWLTAEEANV